MNRKFILYILSFFMTLASINVRILIGVFVLLAVSERGAAQTGSGLTSLRAFRAAEAAVSACKAKGYDVTATVVNKEGLLVAVLRGDDAAPHTLDSSRQKAYTAASFSPIVNIDKTSEIAELLVSNQMSAQLAHLPNILLVGGGIAIRSGGHVVGGIGVGGAPGGNLDEGCAAAGLGMTQDKAK